MRNPVRPIVAAAVAAALATPAALAQQAGDALEEIVVTARKRAENLQELPLSVTAFSEGDIERIGLRGLETISAFSPGLKYSEQGSQRGGRSESVIRFRGMDTNDVTPTRALASVFIDGIYVAGGLSSVSLEEIGRVEVIKGPQSAYFGRTTFGGAVNFVTRPIAEQFEARLSVSAAEDAEYDVSASVEGALGSPALTGRIVGRYYSSDGRHRSIADGGRLGAEETQSVSVSLNFAPSEAFSLKLRGFYGEDDDGPATTFTLTRQYHNCGPFPRGTTTYICGELPVVSSFGTNTVLDPVAYQIYVNNSRNSRALTYGPKLDHLGLRRNALRTSLQGDWQLPWEGTTLQFTGSYASIEQKRLMDLDYTPQKIWLESSFQDITDSSAEVRLTQARERVRWMAGLSYFTLEFVTPNGASVAWLHPNAAFPNGFFQDQTIGTDDVVTTAAFGSVSWDFADQWNLSLEGRYQRDEIDEGTVGNVALKKTFSNFLPRAILQWQPSDATNLYLTYAEGNKPGDFNNNLIPLNPTQLAQAQGQTGAQLTVGEEELKMYELGLKQGLLDRRLQVNTAVYLMEWLNQQTRATAVINDPSNPSGFRTIPVIIAAGRTDLWGLEVEAQWRATRMLTLSGTFNYAGSEYKEFICGFCQRVVGTTDMAGNESPRYPKYSGSLSADLFAPLTASLNWFGRADAIYTGSAWDEAFNLAKTSPFWTVNARGGVEADRWRAELFVTNLFDEDSYPAAARFTDFTKGNFNLNDFTTNVSPADPRQVGVRFSIRL